MPRKGDLVMIYQDPLTREKEEGQAVLLDRLLCDPVCGADFWRVRFIEDGLITERFVSRHEQVISC